jgi:hypothetical protein
LHTSSRSVFTLRRSGPRRLHVGCLAVAVIAAALAMAPTPSMAAACDAPVVNEVACENTKPGTPSSDWAITGAGDDRLQGYATRMSVNKGDTISFKIKSTTGAPYHIDVLRLGYYGGAGARKLASNLVPTGSSTQLACQKEASTGLIDCGNWSVSRSWTVPDDAVSGVYIAHLVQENDPEIESHIVFVVRDDASDSDMVYQTADTTWQAYNRYGGNSLYTCDDPCPPGNPTTYKAAYKVSYNRPNNVEQDSKPSSLFGGAEYSMIRFLEASGYDVSYMSGVDVHARGSLLQNHKLFVSNGHDEYWSKGQRDNMEAARDAGVNLTFFSGNTGFWKTRFEPSIDGSGTADRTLVSYKDTHFQQQQDPVSWTGTWRDGRFAAAADGVTPENALIGTSFLVNSGTSRIVVPAAYRAQRLWRNTGANLLPEQNMNLALRTLGYEWDVDADNGFRPAGTFKMSATTVGGLEVFTDYGSTTRLNGTATHNLTMYRAPSGARVFSAATVQWAWGLDSYHDESTIDVNMRQATVNLFADMGVQPSTLLPGVTAASPSTDTEAPTSAITTIPATVNDGTQITISGTAADTGGGVVAGVEISTDGGQSWHPANGTATWSYTWIAHGNPAASVKVRAVDDSGNLETAGASASITINCPCSLWGRSMPVPVNDRDSGDPTPAEVGVKFKADKFGTVSGLRFYKATTNTGTHVGTLWSASGQPLAQATFANETASGWQTVTFSSPVQIQKDTIYVASYHAPAGHFSASADYFQKTPAPGPNGGSIVDSGPLHAPRNTGTSTTTTTNGFYAYSATSTFPTNSFGASNYWVDVIYTPTAIPGTPGNVTATSGGLTSANVTWTAPTTGGTVTGYRITPYIGDQAQSPTTIQGSPPVTTTTITGLTNGTTYTFRVEAMNPNGTGPQSAASNPVTPLTAVAPSVPRSVVARPASQSARVTWDVPQSDGDSPITGYTVTPYIGSTAQTPVQVGPSTTMQTITGLTNGTSYTFRVTATNGAGTGPAGISPAVIPQATIFDLAVPANPDAGDGSAVELGVKFKADHNGTIVGIRFYKSAANTGTHVGSLWTTTGTLLGQATFTNESESGWQSVTFSTPVAVTAGTTYVASYFAPKGHYAVTSRGLDAPVDNGPLHTIADPISGNGVYAYSSASAFPSNSYNASNYWVDVLYAVPAPGQVTGVVAEASGATSAIVDWSPPSSGGPVSSYRITPRIGSVAQTPTIVTGDPPATQKRITGLTTGRTYTFVVQAVNANGNGPASAASNAVTPQAAVPPTAPTGVTARPATRSALVSWSPPSSDGDSPVTGYTVTPYDGATALDSVSVGPSVTSRTITGLANGTAYTFRVRATNAVGSSVESAASNAVTPAVTILDFATPSIDDSGENQPVTLGVKFRTSFAGTVTGVRFYKSTANTGTHLGTLWSAAGERLAEATFTGETASGWQHVVFSNPVAITPGTTYVASYHAPAGHYSVTSNGFAEAISNPPLEGLSSAVSANGVYTYGASAAFPTSTYNAGNYGVDVLFDPAPAPGEPTGVNATAGSASAEVSWTAPATGGPATSYVLTPYLDGAAQTPKTVDGSPLPTSTTVTGLTPGASYTFTVRAANLSGASAESAPSGAVVPSGSQAPGAPTGATAEADSTSALVRWTAPGDDGGSPITGYTVTAFSGGEAQGSTEVGGSATTARVTGLTNGTTYRFAVSATSSAGTGPASDLSNGVEPKRSLFELATPPTVDAGDSSATVLGVKFTSDMDGAITGVRFYKASANTGTHVGALWRTDGTQLAQGTFSDETSSGWQTLTFAVPVPVTAGTTYVASYHAPRGRYSVAGGAFANPIDNPPLRALANSTSANGVYAYSATPVFPTSTYGSSNYYVDVLFAPGS